jgi:threonylcarbamoyladenosine tRNA methylthiotransferase MtaB
MLQMTNQKKNKISRVAFHTLGCKLNFSETSTISRKFKEEGFEVVSFNSNADFYVINTCSVTDQADKKCRQVVHKIKNQSPDAYIAVVGCYAQLNPEEIASNLGVDLVLGTQEKFNILDHLAELGKTNEPLVYSCEIDKIESFDSSHSEADRTRSFLKVQDGCDYSCSYCTIPLARGKSRNKRVIDLVEETKKIASSGIKEIILSGVNIGDFGKSTDETFFELIKNLEKVDGIERIRISSIEPNLLTDEIIEHVAKSKKILNHFHIPLQSGCNKILAKMQRRYNIELFQSRVLKIKELMPDAFIGVDVIVGFPGETDELFMEAYSFLAQLPVSFYHVFSYSERRNTKSASMDNKVPKNSIIERSKKVHELANKKHEGFYKKHIGVITNVLFESSQKEGKIVGFTENYIKAETKYNKSLIGQVKQVKLISIAQSGNMEISFL